MLEKLSVRELLERKVKLLRELEVLETYLMSSEWRMWELAHKRRMNNKLEPLEEAELDFLMK